MRSEQRLWWHMSGRGHMTSRSPKGRLKLRREGLNYMARRAVRLVWMLSAAEGIVYFGHL